MKTKFLILIATVTAATTVTFALFWIFISSFQAFLEMSDLAQRVIVGSLVLTALTINIGGAYAWLKRRSKRRHLT